MRSLTGKDGDPLSYFGNINDIDKKTSKNKNSLNDRLIISHSVEVNRGEIRGQIPLEHTVGFCKTIEKITKRFHSFNIQNI